jgi:antitoxin component of MazEF toxin-antitoxin module
MRIKLTKRDDGLAAIIPAELVQRFELTEGATVDIRSGDTQPEASPERVRYRIEDLVGGMSHEAMRDAFDRGDGPSRST